MIYIKRGGRVLKSTRLFRILLDYAGAGMPDLSALSSTTGQLRDPADNDSARYLHQGGVTTMSHTKMLRFIAAMLVLATLPLGATNDWVAQPERSAGVKWEQQKFCGRDFWIVLSDDVNWGKYLPDEPFVKNAAVIFPRSAMGLETPTYLRTMRINSLEVTQAGKNKTLDFTVNTPEKDTAVIKRENHVLISANPQPVKLRNTPVEATLLSDISNETPLEKVAINHGYSNSNDVRIASARFFIDGEELKASGVKNLNGILSADFQEAPKGNKLEIRCLSEYPIYKFRFLSPEQEARAKGRPFAIHGLSVQNIWGLSDINVDTKAREAFRLRYADNFIGYEIGEWDSNYLNVYLRPSSALFRDLKEYMRVPADRDGQAKNLYDYFKLLKSIHGKMFGMSGQLNGEHYGMEAGGEISSVEVTGENPDYLWRTSLMYVRGAARQYDAPWKVYLAYYASDYTASSQARGTMGLDYGIPPSLGRRLFFLSYYMGNSFISFECEPYGQIVKNQDGSHSLTKNGEAVRDIYAWANKPEGKRGNLYTPVLILIDWNHGFLRFFAHAFNTWKGQFPFTDADYMADHITQAIDPVYPDLPSEPLFTKKFVDPKYTGNLRNSKLGDIFDVYIANQPSGSVRLEQLEKYAVVQPAGEIGFTADGVNTLKEYVEKGGTLVLNAAQSEAFAKLPNFLGLQVHDAFINEENMKISKVSLAPNAMVLLKTQKGTPLLVKNRYGDGNVLFSTPYYLLNINDKKEVLPIVSRILETIQNEVIPVKVEGDIEFLFNHMDDGSWKLILVNNRGMVKAPNQSVEQYFNEFTATVKITAPADAEAAEVFGKAEIAVTQVNGNKIFTIEVPPAGIRVLDLKNVPFGRSLPEEPVLAKWDFNDKTGRDSSGNKRDMQLYGMEFAKTPDGYCLDLKQENSYGLIDFPVDYTVNEGAYEFWACPDLLAKPEQGVSVIIHQPSILVGIYQKHWGIRVAAGSFNTYGKLAEGPEVTSNKWAHIVVVWRDYFCRLFVNGEEVVLPTGPIKFFRTIGNDTFYNQCLIHFGSATRAWVNTFQYHGKLDDFTFYRKALAPDKIKANYSKGLKKYNQE